MAKTGRNLVKDIETAIEKDRDVLESRGYSIKKLLGIGGFALVYKAVKHFQNSDYETAVKIVKKQENFHEATMLRSLDHRNIVKFVEDFDTKEYTYLTMEACQETLENKLKRKGKLHVDEGKVVMQSLCLAANYLHEREISHRDIKPKNILVSIKKTIIYKLTDFGIAISYSNIEPDCQYDCYPGTLNYMAPERLKLRFRAESDLWSIGIVMLECLHGLIKTQVSYENMLLRLNAKELYNNALLSSSAKPTQHLLNSLLIYDPNHRISFSDFYNHPFIDAENVPCEENFDKVIRLLRRAEKQLQSGQHNAAIDTYILFDSFITQYLIIECRPDYKRALTKLKYKYKTFADDIKRQKHYKPTDLDQLVAMAHSTPKMATGLEIGLVGDEYQREGKYTLAIQKYEEALELLFPTMKDEPSGPRWNLLGAQMKKWIRSLEVLKQIGNDEEHKAETNVSQQETIGDPQPGSSR